MSAKKSSQPRKTRKALYEAPLHVRQKLVSVHLSRELRKKLKKRSVPAHKGDKVLVLKGRFKKKQGAIAKVDLKKSLVFVEGILVKTQRGKENMAAIAPSTLVALELAERKPKQKQKKAQAQAQKTALETKAKA